MKLIVLLLFIVSLVDLVYCNRCCTDGKWVTSDEKCSDGKSMKLKCDKNSTIVLNPKADPVDTFYIKEDDNGLVIEERDLKLNRSEYCLTKVEVLDGSITDYDVAIICNDGKSELEMQYTFFLVFLAVILFLSIISIILTIIVYLKIPELMDTQGKVLVIFTIILNTAYVLAWFNLVSLSNEIKPYALCVIYAYLLYFSFIATFSWLNVVSFNLFRNIVYKADTFDEKKLMVYYLSWGFGFPTFMTVCCMIYRVTTERHYEVAFGGEDFCWVIDNATSNWTFFTIPRSFLILLNIIMFSWVSWKLWKDHFEYQNMAKVYSERSRVLLYIRLFLIMGVPWVLDVITEMLYQVLPVWVWYITDSISCSQGVVIFLVLVVFRRRVKRGLAKHKVWGINWPQTWLTEQDTESETQFANEVELAQNKT